MVSHPNRGRPPRPLQHLHAAGAMYPNAWRQIDIFRRDRGKDLPDWPDWCFLPMAAWYSIVSADAGVDRLPLHLAGDVSRLAALGSWRYTQSIYRLDDDLRASIAETVPRGELPCDVIYRLPEWCVYIETPGMIWSGSDQHGFFAHLERDMNTQRDELRLLIDSDISLTPVPLHLGPWTITEAVDRAVAESNRQGKKIGLGIEIPAEFVESNAMALYPLVSLLLYVCSNGVEYGGESRPSNPNAKRTKKGWRLFPAQKPRYWDLGRETGDKIRAAHESTGRGGKKSPHIRRAHWHGYWSGPRDGEREFNLKWLPPIIVAAEEDPDD